LLPPGGWGLIKKLFQKRFLFLVLVAMTVTMVFVCIMAILLLWRLLVLGCLLMYRLGWCFLCC